MTEVQTLKLNNGRHFPVLGLGTWNSTPGQVAQAVKDAIDAGYRHIDCAHVYQNEHEVGEGINAKISEGVIRRDAIWVTSKLWNSYHDPKEVRGAIEHTLKQLQLDYLDLYLIHWPMGYVKSNELFPKNENGEIMHTNFDLMDTYREMEKLVEAGLTKSIGISNFNKAQVDYIVANAKIQPVTNQIEVHPYLLNKELISHCRSKNLIVTAYSPLGSPGRSWASALGSSDHPFATAEERIVLKEPKLLAIAEKYKKSPGQILVRYQIQIGNVVIPKSVTKERIISNSEVFDFTLTDEDIKDIESFGYTERIYVNSEDAHHPQYPFH